MSSEIIQQDTFDRWHSPLFNTEPTTLECMTERAIDAEEERDRLQRENERLRIALRMVEIMLPRAFGDHLWLGRIKGVLMQAIFRAKYKRAG